MCWENDDVPLIMNAEVLITVGVLTRRLNAAQGCVWSGLDRVVT